jgi:hypothetical protein
MYIEKQQVDEWKHTDADESRLESNAVFGTDGCSPDNLGDIDWLFWSIWFEFVFNGENGDDIALGLVGDNVRFRANILVPFGWELFTGRVDGDGTIHNRNKNQFWS